MRAAPSARADGAGDGRGARLVWSPLSNLLLYGETTRVDDAIAEDVLVSLGTDWTPGSSRTLLRDADRVLREQAPELAERALVDMVTRNPALTLRRYDSRRRAHFLTGPAGQGACPWVDAP